MRAKKNFFLKIGMLLFLGIYLTFIYTSNNAKDISMEAITISMESDSTLTALPKRGRTDLKRYYQIEESASDGYIFYKAISPMAVEECLIIKAENRQQAESFRSSAESHLESQKGIFEGYGTDQMALLNKAIVDLKGNYVFYMCGADAAQWHQNFLNLI